MSTGEKNIYPLIGQRLREERKRLRLTQAEFGELGGAAYRSVADWERGVSVPNAAFLAAIDEAGADVMYILTGRSAGREVVPADPREAALLDNYRHSPAEGKDAIERTASALAKPAGQVKKKAG